MAIALRTQQERAIDRAARVVESLPPDPAARVVQHLKTSQLITSRIDTTVRAQEADENWFGSVVATVEAPARLSYGVDVSKLEASRVVFSPVGGICTVRVPEPRRIATEVFTGEEKTMVEISGLRFRALAGEEQLGQARANLHDRALRMRLVGEDLARMRENAREEIADLVRRIVGEGVVVRVNFDEEKGTVASGPQ